MANKKKKKTNSSLKSNKDRRKDIKYVKKPTYPHFRKYLKSKHPALIVGENGDDYKYRKVMHQRKDGRHINEKIDPNPNHNDNKPMYISKRIKKDNKKFFSKWIYAWKYSENKKK